MRDGTVDTDERIKWIVVGVDGSDTADHALNWALQAGRLHQATVQVVHATAIPYGVGESFVPVAYDTLSVEAAARRTLDAAVEAADTRGLRAPVTRTLAPDNASAALLEAAEAADLVVVGSRGLGGFKGLVLGSVSHHVAHDSPCPVIVLPSLAD